jgi:hypothetical protein
LIFLVYWQGISQKTPMSSFAQTQRKQQQTYSNARRTISSDCGSREKIMPSWPTMMSPENLSAAPLVKRAFR